MQDSLEEVAFAVGGALVSPSVGAGELIVAVIVALAFGLSAVQTALTRGRHDQDWRRRF